MSSSLGFTSKTNGEGPDGHGPECPFPGAPFVLEVWRPTETATSEGPTPRDKVAAPPAPIFSGRPPQPIDKDDERKAAVKYALLIYNQEGGTREAMTDEERRRFDAVVDEVLARPNIGPWVRLRETESATTIRHGERGVFLTDGPFVDSKEYIAGLIVVDAANLDQALAVATELEELRPGGAIEVRPMRDSLPSED